VSASSSSATPSIDVSYRTTSGNLGYRGHGAGITFSLWRGGGNVWQEEAVLGEGLVRLPLGVSPPGDRAVIYLPEGMQPLIQSVSAVRGAIIPAPALPRWIAYGDSATQGWIASPSQDGRYRGPDRRPRSANIPAAAAGKSSRPSTSPGYGRYHHTPTGELLDAHAPQREPRRCFLVIRQGHRSWSSARSFALGRGRPNRLGTSWPRHRDGDP
jgi:hypothetical protein